MTVDHHGSDSFMEGFVRYVQHKRLRGRTSLELVQAACLSYLVFQFRHVNPNRYVSSRELMDYIRDRRPSSLTLLRFQT